ncbi:MAG: hypothetical protein ACFB9N_17240 [Geitlerinemataceae cyanobacterium]
MLFSTSGHCPNEAVQYSEMLVLCRSRRVLSKSIEARSSALNYGW